MALPLERQLPCGGLRISRWDGPPEGGRRHASFWVLNSYQRMFPLPIPLFQAFLANSAFLQNLRFCLFSAFCCKVLPLIQGSTPQLIYCLNRVAEKAGKTTNLRKHGQKRGELGISGGPFLTSPPTRAYFFIKRENWLFSGVLLQQQVFIPKRVKICKINSITVFAGNLPKMKAFLPFFRV